MGVGTISGGLVGWQSRCCCNLAFYKQDTCSMNDIFSDLLITTAHHTPYVGSVVLLFLDKFLIFSVSMDKMTALFSGGATNPRV